MWTYGMNEWEQPVVQRRANYEKWREFVAERDLARQVKR